VLLLDEPFGALDARVRAELRAWLRDLHKATHLTTILVTHDQEEALEVADEIVVINEGRIEQIGSPDQLYDEPANDFVMSFLGPTTVLNGRLVRPHDIEVYNHPVDAGIPARIARELRVGFDVRLTVELLDAVHDEIEVTVTRATQRSLGLSQGNDVWLVPTVSAGTPRAS